MSKGILQMKKLTAIILAIVMASTAVLVGCSDGENNAKTPVTETPVNVEESTEYNTAIETRIETIVTKNDLDKEILLNVAGVPVSAAAVRYAVIACNSFYEGDTSEDVEQQKADEIDNFYRLNAAVVNMADELGITIDDEEFKTNFTDNYEFLKEQYGEDLETVIDSYTFQSPFFYMLNQYYNFLYTKLHDHYMEDEEFAATVREATLTDMLESETPYVRAKHILICFPEEGEGENGEVTEAQKQETFNKANEVLALVNNGDDFDSLVQQYGEDPGMSSYPGGYYFTTGKMVPEFEETTFALAEGETSGLVETTYGYHIILRLPLDDDAIVATDEYSAKSYELFAEKLNAVADEYDISYADNYEEKCDEYLVQYQEMMNPVVEDEAGGEEPADAE